MDANKKSKKWVWIVLVLIVASAYPIWYAVQMQNRPATTAETAKPVTVEGVSCLGRIEPADDVLHVAGPHIPGDPHPPSVVTIHVKEGDHVKKGDLLAVFTGVPELQANVDRAQTAIAVARRRLEQIKAGVKPQDLAVQEAETARLEVDLQHAKTDLARYEALRKTADVTETEVDAHRTAVRLLEKSIEQSNRRLESLKVVPDTDIRVAEAQVQDAVAGEAFARRQLEVASLHAPMDGEVLKIHAHPGEEQGPEGVLDLAKTSQMYAVAEVYDTDITRVKPGQTAVISGDLLGTTTLSGTVERIEPTVKVASVLPGDTVTFADHRIIEVRIRLDNGEPVSGRINGKVNVVIKSAAAKP